MRVIARHFVQSLLAIYRELRQTAEKNSAQANRQTDRQTDTTKIMVTTWP